MIVATGLHFNPYAGTSFEPAKAAMARSFLALLAAGWLALQVSVRAREGGNGAPRRSRWLSPVPRVALWVFVAWSTSTILSASVSIAPTLSRTGSYARAQGAWIELGYVALFTVIAVGLSTVGQWNRLRFTITTSSVAVSLLALAQWVENPIPLGNFPVQVISTQGNSTFLAGFLLLPVFVTADYLIEAAVTGRESRADVDRPQAGRLWRFTLPSLIIVAQLAALAATRVPQRSSV